MKSKEFYQKSADGMIKYYEEIIVEFDKPYYILSKFIAYQFSRIVSSPESREEVNLFYMVLKSGYKGSGMGGIEMYERFIKWKFEYYNPLNSIVEEKDSHEKFLRDIDELSDKKLYYQTLFMESIYDRISQNSDSEEYFMYFSSLEMHKERYGERWQKLYDRLKSAE